MPIFDVFQPWYWRKIELNFRTGSDIFQALFLTDNHTIATLLESPHFSENHPPENQRLCRYSICAGKPRTILNNPLVWTPKTGQVFPFLRSLLAQNKPVDFEQNIPFNLPFTGGWLGWLGYDLAWEIENLPHKNQDLLPFPLAYWYEPECFAILDHLEQVLWLAASNFHQLDEMEKRLTNPSKILVPNHPQNLCKIKLEMTQIQYENAVIKAKEYIKRGDIFQTNLSLRFSTETTVDSWLIYQELHTINPSPFASYWQTPWGCIISCSPERLVQLTGKKVQTRPIAGTRPRGKTLREDQNYAQELLNNQKERAEHIMLVDLERNDLGKCCQWGTVEVDELLTIERYSHVMHLVSNITGLLSKNYDSIDVIKGVFPGGTITGCPKVRCMEIIEELEPVKRNLFYGSCGYLDWRGDLDLNILIRTLLYHQKPQNPTATVWGQVGAGIVADSNPETEWQESLQKAQAQLKALQL